MALFDVLHEFSNGQTLTTTSLSDNVLNFGQADLEMGAGEPIWLNVRMVSDFHSAGTTLIVSLYRHTSATVSSGTVIWATPAINFASLTAGDWVIRMPLPYNVDEDKFIGLYYTIAGTCSTKSVIDAWLDHGPQSSYDTQVSVSNV